MSVWKDLLETFRRLMRQGDKFVALGVTNQTNYTHSISLPLMLDRKSWETRKDGKKK